MAIIRFNPYSYSWMRPFSWDEEEMPTVTEGLNVYEEGNKVYVEAPLPGIPEEKINVNYEDGVLTISGQSEEQTEEKKKNRIVHKMQRLASFNYTTYLPRAIDEKKLEATVKDGIVTISAPVAETAKARRIPVRKAAK